MERIKKEDLEILYGNMISEKDLMIHGYGNSKFHFEIYDGFAYCPDKDISLIFPKMSFANKSNEMKEKIREYLNLSEDEKISIYDLIQTFNEMFIDNVRVQYDSEKQEYIPKLMWKI